MFSTLPNIFSTKSAFLITLTPQKAPKTTTVPQLSFYTTLTVLTPSLLWSFLALLVCQNTGGEKVTVPELKSCQKGGTVINNVQNIEQSIKQAKSSVGLIFKIRFLNSLVF